jgi:hypothetical protein
MRSFLFLAVSLTVLSPIPAKVTRQQLLLPLPRPRQYYRILVSLSAVIVLANKAIYEETFMHA